MAGALGHSIGLASVSGSDGNTFKFVLLIAVRERAQINNIFNVISDIGDLSPFSYFSKHIFIVYRI